MQLFFHAKQKIIKIACLLFLMVTGVSWGEDRILESIQVVEKNGYSIIDIRLNQQLTVVSYAPPDEGELLRLRVRRTGVGLQIDEPLTNFETLPWEPTATVPLYNVSVDLQGEILLFFKRKVKYSVLPATNAFHIKIKVDHPKRIIEIKERKKIDKSVSQEKREEPVDPKVAELMEKARKALLDRKYSHAVQLYTKVLSQVPLQSDVARKALELMGLAREKNKQYAHAKAIYEQFLLRYPEGEDAERVRQRLFGIITAETEPKEKLKEGKNKSFEQDEVYLDIFGSFSQFYNRVVSKFNDDQSRLNRSAIQNGLDFSLRAEFKDFNVNTRFSGTYNLNIETSDDDEERIHTGYIDFSHKGLKSNLRIGRQTRSSGGILGRFDGGVLSIQLNPAIRLNMVAGYSVNSSRDIFLNTDQYFYGINADLGSFWNAWDFNIFFIEQYNQSFLDRRAVGGEIKYFQENRSFFSFIDYDIYHDKLNSFLFTGQWGFLDRTIINISYDYRRVPFVITSNALQGQGLLGVESLSELLGFFSLDEIVQMASDRTARAQSLTVSLSKPLSDKLQLNADYRMATMSSTKASGGVEGSDGTEIDFFYSVDLTASNLLADSDIYVIGARYSDMDRFDSISVFANARYPVTQSLRVNPRFRFDYRQNNDGTKRYFYQPSVRIIQKLFKGLQLEVEGGGDWSFQEKTTETILQDPDSGKYDETKGYYVFVGYRYNF